MSKKRRVSLISINAEEVHIPLYGCGSNLSDPTLDVDGLWEDFLGGWDDSCHRNLERETQLHENAQGDKSEPEPQENFLSFGTMPEKEQIKMAEEVSRLADVGFSTVMRVLMEADYYLWDLEIEQKCGGANRGMEKGDHYGKQR